MATRRARTWLRERVRGSFFRWVLSVAIVLIMGNVLQVRRFEYLSFETVVGAEAIGQARSTSSRLYFGPAMVTEYLIVRDDFAIRLHVDPKVMFPHVTVQVEGLAGRASLGTLVAASVEAWDAKGGQVECGELMGQRRVAEDGTETPSTSFTFLWGRCGKTNEAVMAFDVIGPTGVVVQERLPFRIDTKGFFMEHSWFGGGVLGWGTPIQENRQSVREGGRGGRAVFRLMLGPGSWEAGF